MQRNDWFLASAIGGVMAVGLLLAWLIETFPTATAAAWFQGIGTLMAVFAAIFAPIIIRALERSDARRERTERSIQYVQHLLPYVGDLELKLDMARKKLQDLAGLPPANGNIPPAVRALRIELAPGALDALMRMHDFDPGVTRAVSAAIEVTASYNNVVDRYYAAAMDDLDRFERKVRPSAISSIADHLNRLEPFYRDAMRSYGAQ